MTSKPENPYVYPLAVNSAEVQKGITLRDYFAVQAISAIPWLPHTSKPEDFAEWAYKLADAMLKAREA